MKYRWCVRTMPKNVFFFPLFLFFFFSFLRSMIMRLQSDIESRMKYRRDRGKINSRPSFEGIKFRNIFRTKFLSTISGIVSYAMLFKN